MNELAGKLLVKNETKSYGDNGFTKRDFVIETESQYPQKILIELIKDKCSLLDSFNIGDSLKVSYNINGREWINPEGAAKYFNSIQGWRIDKVEAQTQSNEAQNEPQKDNGDLPF